ncbi:MAG: hypothetical protein LPK07_10875 [Hymenobacteraceae bacterium]|nr:hypothetical protein [Hymenobacteraceae bacterium]
MHIKLYSDQQKARTRRNTGLMGFFLSLGGGYALFRELFLLEALRTGWIAASVAIVVVGALFLAVATGLLKLKDAYFSMTPELINYRLAPLSLERFVLWHNVKALQISKHKVVFELRTGKKVRLKFGSIQEPEVALHVSRSIHLAALEKGIMINHVGAAKEPATVA